MNRPFRRFAALVGTLTLGVGVFAAVGVGTASAASVPYSDTKSSGYIGLCDKSGKQITSGSITTKPFAWRAVSSVKAPAGYDGKDATAALYAFQPRKGVDPLYWSGDLLTASSTYSNPAHPIAAATDTDEPLTTNLDDYPADWDGYYQLRLYLGAPGKTAYQDSYASTDLKVSGTTWTVVRGGTVDCAGSGTAVSNETKLLGSKATTTKAATSAAKPTSPASGAATGGATSAPSAGATTPGAAANGAVSAADASTPSSSSSNNGPLLIAVVLLAVALLGGGGFLWYRRKAVAE